MGSVVFDEVIADVVDQVEPEGQQTRDNGDNQDNEEQKLRLFARRQQRLAWLKQRLEAD